MSSKQIPPKTVAVFPSVREMTFFPRNCNPFHHDLSHMGTPLVRGWVAMHEGYGRPDVEDQLRYVILVNTRTGRRLRVDISELEDYQEPQPQVLDPSSDRGRFTTAVTALVSSLVLSGCSDLEIQRRLAAELPQTGDIIFAIVLQEVLDVEAEFDSPTMVVCTSSVGYSLGKFLIFDSASRQL